MYCAQQLGRYLEGQGHSMTFQQNSFRPITLWFEVRFYNFFWQTTSLCPIPIRGALPGSDRLLCTDDRGMNSGLYILFHINCMAQTILNFSILYFRTTCCVRTCAARTSVTWISTCAMPACCTCWLVPGVHRRRCVSGRRCSPPACVGSHRGQTHQGTGSPALDGSS